MPAGVGERVSVGLAYGAPVITALQFLCAVQGTPCGRLLAVDRTKQIVRGRSPNQAGKTVE